MKDSNPLLCLVPPRFYPVIGGIESYCLDIAKSMTSYFNTMVVTSNINKISRNILEKYSFLEKNYDIIDNRIEVIRANTMKNSLLKIIFFFNQFINQKIEKVADKYINPQIYALNKGFNQKVSRLLSKVLLYQRSFANPNFSQIYYILKKIHKANKIDIIHSTPIYLTSNYYAYKFAKKNKVPFINEPYYHINPYADYILYPSYQETLKKSDIVIAQTNIEKNYLIKYGVNSDKIHIIPVGIDPKDYQKPDIASFKKKYNIPEKTPLLLFLGRRSFEKGVFQCILALKYLIKKFPDLKLMIAGLKTRNYQLFYERISKDLKEYIIDLGFVDKETKNAAFASCDVFLSPSLDDAFGIVYTEAWLFKKPVIGVLEGNVAGVIDDNENGFLVPFKNVKILANKVEILLRNDDLCKKFGQNGYKKVYREYLSEITSKKLLAVYQKLC